MHTANGEHMTYILIFWTAVASTAKYDWRPLAEFSSATKCEEAARQLNLEQRYRCVQK
jgi:hypothetical protein